MAVLAVMVVVMEYLETMEQRHWVYTNWGSGAGGAAGKAINLNGQTITWLGGNNGTQVKGAVQ